MEDEIKYVPAGKYTTAGDVLLDWQPFALGTQREPLAIAALIAAVSSVTPSPGHWFSNRFWTLQNAWKYLWHRMTLHS